MLLEGIRVLDLTRLLPGGFCTMILADLGAEVIKVEDPFVGDYIKLFPPYKGDIGVFHYAINRGKKGVVLNLKDDGDREKFYNLVKESHVVIEGFRRGVAERLGVDFETLRGINPRLVYCSISGFAAGKSSKPIHDLNAQALSGILDVHFKRYGRHVWPLIPIGDLGAGVLCSVAVLGGLIYSLKFGEGIKLDVGMVESAALLNIIPIIALLNGGRLEEIIGGKPRAYYSTMESRDGKIYSIAPIEEKFWRSFKKFINLGADDRESEEAYLEALEKFKRKTSVEIESFISKEPCCVERVLEVSELEEYEFLSDLIGNLEGVKVLKTPIYINGKLYSKLSKPPLETKKEENFSNKQGE